MPKLRRGSPSKEDDSSRLYQAARMAPLDTGTWTLGKGLEPELGEGFKWYIVGLTFALLESIRCDSDILRFGGVRN